MRKLSKVICERPRRKNKGNLAIRKSRLAARLDPQEAPAVRGMRRIHHVYVGPGGVKEHGEHLKPLFRWLRKQVGRRWNDVFSELCDQLDKRSTVQRHVLIHVDGYVLHHVLIINGVPHMRVGLGQPVELWEGQLYVDPDGVLAQHSQMN